MKASKRSLVVAVCLSFIVIIWFLPRWQVARDSHPGAIANINLITSENDYRHTLVQGLTNLALFFSLWLAWKKLEMLGKHAVAAEELQKTTHESKITERFYRAVQQLANEYTEVRLGGIYALERIIVDSPRDKNTIHQILSAYVRMRSLDDLSSVTLREDLRACLEVLARSSPAVVDLGRLNLAGKDLSHLNLSGFWLEDARLEEVDLYRAKLKRAMLPHADLRRAELVEAQLQGADLSGANLERANLTRAQLHGAVLDGANFRGANLRDALGLSRAQLSACITDETTNFPEEALE